MIDQQAFQTARNKIIGTDRKRTGIGTLSEKTVHAILKNYYQPDEDFHEIPIDNYIADIYENGEIIEIQTRQFNKLRNKLDSFLQQYIVTVIYPIPREKFIIWIDEESGELSKPRKSPLKGSPYAVFPELYKIKTYLKNPNLKFKLLLMDMEEYKLLNGWSRDKKKGSSRYDRIPTNLVEEIEINRAEDYMQFVPYELEDEFTVKEFAKAAHINSALAQMVVNILFFMGIIVRTGKSGRAYLYSVSSVPLTQ